MRGTTAHRGWLGVRRWRWCWPRWAHVERLSLQPRRSRTWRASRTAQAIAASAELLRLWWSTRTRTSAALVQDCGDCGGPIPTATERAVDAGPRCRRSSRQLCRKPVPAPLSSPRLRRHGRPRRQAAAGPPGRRGAGRPDPRVDFGNSSRLYGEVALARRPARFCAAGRDERRDDEGAERDSRGRPARVQRGKAQMAVTAIRVARRAVRSGPGGSAQLADERLAGASTTPCARSATLAAQDTTTAS